MLPSLSCVFCSSHAITSDVSVTETAEAAEMFLSDGIILSGTATGKATNPSEIAGTIYYFLLVHFRTFVFFYGKGWSNMLLPTLYLTTDVIKTSFD